MGRPAVLLSCWALVAEPEDLLVALQPVFVRKVAVVCIATVIPLSQQDRVLCNGWVCNPLCGPCRFNALQTAANAFADSGSNFCTPLVATMVTAAKLGSLAGCPKSHLPQTFACKQPALLVSITPLHTPEVCQERH